MVASDTDRLEIVPLEPGHAGVLFPLLRDPEMYRYLDETPPASVEALAARYRHLATGGPGDERWRNWVVATKAAGEPVGTLQATILGDGRALIAYVFLPRSWRHGYATEAVRWMLDELRDGDGVTRVDAIVDTRNAASIRLLERIGFERVETVRGAATIRGEPSDEHRYTTSLGV